jgi:nucleoside-diphosphate-sugar epimerase
MKKTISVLGCGWLGLPLAKSFVKEGYSVKGSVTSEGKLELLRTFGIEPHLIKLSEQTVIVDDEIFFDADVLIITVPPRSKTQQKGVYFLQMKGLAAILSKHHRIKHVIYTSSTSIYPDQVALMTEDRVHMPDQAGSVELVEVENLILGLPFTTTVLRLGGLTGGSRMLARHFAGKVNLPQGCFPVNLIHLEDAVGVIRFMLERLIGGVFNACSPLHPLKKDFYSILAKRFNLTLPQFNPDDVTSGKTIDVSKLEATGYIFVYPDPYDYSYDLDEGD